MERPSTARLDFLGWGQPFPQLSCLSDLTKVERLYASSLPSPGLALRAAVPFHFLPFSGYLPAPPHSPGSLTSNLVWPLPLYCPPSTLIHFVGTSPSPPPLGPSYRAFQTLLAKLPLAQLHPSHYPMSCAHVQVLGQDTALPSLDYASTQPAASGSQM